MNRIRFVSRHLVLIAADSLGLQYKYMLDVDGNGWSGRFHKLMSTKSMVLKSTLFPEWYSDRIQPWVQYVASLSITSRADLASRSYVPVKIDYADLYDIMTFFRGTPDGQSGHDDLAEKIGTAGKMWARDHVRFGASLHFLNVELTILVISAVEETGQ